MPREYFTNINTWVFDLDNTLYHPSARLFDQIEVKMTCYIMSLLDLTRDQACTLRSTYWQKYGTTLSGLMQEHGMDPIPFLNDVHDISMDHLDHDADLATHIRNLPGRKIVYTNGDAPYAQRVLTARGIEGLFDAVYGIEHAGFVPKPEPSAFAKVFDLDGLTPATAAMFEDDPRNLAVPHRLNMRTVLVHTDHPPQDHIHHHTDDLTKFLSHLS